MLMLLASGWVTCERHDWSKFRCCTQFVHEGVKYLVFFRLSLRFLRFFFVMDQISILAYVRMTIFWRHQKSRNIFVHNSCDRKSC